MNFTPTHIDRENDRLQRGLVVYVLSTDGHVLHLACHKPDLTVAVNAGKYGLATRIRQHMSTHREWLQKIRGD